MAGLRAAEALRAEGYRGSLVLIGDEPGLPYDRPPLSKEILLHELQKADIALHFADEIVAERMLGHAIALDPEARRITLADGQSVSFDGLVIATGSTPRRLAELEPDGKSVFELRKLSDSLGLRARLDPGRRLLVVGSGFIGVEVASMAVKLGLRVSMVGSSAPLKVAGELVSSVASTLLRTANVDLHLGHTIVQRSVIDGAHQIVLDNGDTIAADVILVAIGAVPQVHWLSESGLQLGDGLVCDATLHAAENIVAAGDIVNWPNLRFDASPMRVEHWANAIEQGRAAARALLSGPDAQPFDSVPSFWSDHFGLRLQSIGALALADEFRISDGDPAEGRFAAGAYRNGQLVGAVTYGMPRGLLKHRAVLALPHHV